MVGFGGFGFAKCPDLPHGTLLGDHAKGEDLLLLKDEAEALADTIAYKDLEAPFVVGLLGRWGSGKSHLFSLMKDRLAAIQEQPVTESNDFSFAGHIYLIKFDAWTYAKGNMWSSFMYTILKELNKQLHLEAELSKSEKYMAGSAKQWTPSNENKESLVEKLCLGWNDLHSYLFPPEDVNHNRTSTFSKLYRLFRILLGCLVFLLASFFLAISWAVLISLSKLRDYVGNTIDTTIDGWLAWSAKIIGKMKPGNHVGHNRDEVEANRKEFDRQGRRDNITDEEAKGKKDPSDKSAENTKVNDRVKPVHESDKQNDTDNRANGSLSPERDYQRLKNGISLIKIQDSDKATREEYLQSRKEKFKETFRYNVDKCSAIIDMDIPNVTDELARAGNANYSKDIRDFQGLSNIKRWQDEKPGEFRFDDALKAIKEAHKSTDDKPDPAGIEAFGKLTFINKLKLVFSPQFLLKTKGIIIPLLVAAAMAVLWILVEDWSTKIGALLASVAAPFAILVPVVKGKLEEISGTLKDKNDKFQKNFAESRIYAQNVFSNDDQENDQENPTPALEEEIKELKEKVWLRKGKGLREIGKDRVGASSYETDLGIVHQAQQDLMRLSNSMRSEERQSEEKGSKENMFPRGDPRIVLIIDDIDRCPPDQVVDVLEALQLLVKTKLFVVLIALNTQYVTLALEEKYQILNATNGWHPSGTDYIEKILQISYRLAPIERPEAVQGYVKSQLEVSEDKATSSKPTKHELSITQPAANPESQQSPGENASAITPVNNSNESDLNGNGDTQGGDNPEFYKSPSAQYFAPTPVNNPNETDLNGDVDSQKYDKQLNNRLSHGDNPHFKIMINDEDEPLVPGVLKALHFEEYEKSIVMKAAECTALFPRSLKRVMNIVKITKFLWHRQSRKRYETAAQKRKEKGKKKRSDHTDDWIEDKEFSDRERRILRESSICLLVVCAASNLPIRRRIANFYSRYELMVVGKDKLGNAHNLKELIIQNGFGELNCEYTRPMEEIFLKFSQVWWYDQGKGKDSTLKFNGNKWKEVKDVLRLVRAFSIIPERNIDDYELSNGRFKANLREERESLIVDTNSLRELLSTKSGGPEMDQELRNTDLEGSWCSGDFYGGHGREWVQVSALVGGTANAYFIEAVKVTGDANIPAGYVTWKTLSWPKEGQEAGTPAQLQVRDGPSDPDGFMWESGTLILVSKTEIRFEWGGHTGTFVKKELD
ncbi:unnamed protein product [Cylindrotheca closterium]|uniref:KAP NTPase domain-containing protein n=1 Tax=Cylindrotheca closterium TaxID=2856 RepID=A0AAD2CBK4_9STRA|nr:unnamed protein product [Cylindrotheca closterium]